MPAVSIAAAGNPDVRSLGGWGPSATAAQIAHDSVLNRSLLVYLETGTRFESPQFGVMAVLLAADGSRLAGPTLIAAVRERPHVAYNARSGEYLVVFNGTAQRLSADGAPVGVPETLQLGGAPSDIAYRPRTNDFLVVSSGGQLSRLSASGVQIGPAKDFGGTGVAAIAAEPDRPHALITFSSDSGVYARKVVGATATPTAMRQIAPAGRDPAVAYSPTADEHPVVWTAPASAGGGPTTIRGQHLTHNLREIGPDDFRVSSPVTPPTVPERNEFAPAVAADTGSTGYLAAWNVELDPVFGFYRVVARRLVAQR